MRVCVCIGRIFHRITFFFSYFLHRCTSDESTYNVTVSHMLGGAGGMNGSVVFEIERPENGGLKRPIRVRTRHCIPEISIEPSRNLPGTFQEPSRSLLETIGSGSTFWAFHCEVYHFRVRFFRLFDFWDILAFGRQIQEFRVLEFRTFKL